MPIGPSLLTDETLWQVMHDDRVNGTPAFSPSMIELPRNFGAKKSVCTPSSRCWFSSSWQQGGL
jgi:hypothetical protein